MQSLYRRPLPESLIAFASREGRTLFREALEHGSMESYFALAEQHHTQADPAFCGLGSLVVALNALGIDPGRLWKGPWRWFSEELLDCCVPLEHVRRSGLTLDELGCLASCNGARSVVQRADTQTETEARSAIAASARSAVGPVLIASYSRTALGQTGSGHFSPLAGYHAARDLVLLLDVARFKYPPHWVPVSMLFRAMREIDPTTGKSRGLISLERAAAPRNLAFVFTNSGGGWQQVAAFLGAELRQLLQRREPATAHAAVTPILGAAGDVARGIALRDTADVEHRRIVDAMLGNLRATALHQLSQAVGAVEGTLPELATALLYLVPLETWQVLPANVAAELVQLSDVESLAEPLKSDVSVLRRQLAELQACTPAGAATIAPSQE